MLRAMLADVARLSRRACRRYDMISRHCCYLIIRCLSMPIFVRLVAFFAISLAMTPPR